MSTVPPTGPASPPASEPERLAREVFRELIEIDTSEKTTEAAEAVAARLRAAGFPGDDVRVLGPVPGKENLVARLRGSGGRRPLLLLAHLDVVAARPEEWSVDPFALTEKEGHFYGRGTTDDKAMAALWVTNLIRLRQEGFVPERDLVLALTADEEGGDQNGAEWLLENHRDLVEAELGLNEGGYGRIRDGRRISNTVQASEKVYLDLELVARGRGGHSSLPDGESAIYRLSEGLSRLARFQFPLQLSEITRGFFLRMSEIESGQTAADMRAILRTPPDSAAVARLSRIPYYNGLMRTTSAATRLEAGQSNNTIPPTARAVVNCRLLPGESAEEVRSTVEGAIEDARIEVRPLHEAQPSPPSPLDPGIMGPIERITAEMWPGVPVVPVMGIGGTDSRHFRAAGIPMYGVSGIFLDVDDVRAHAADERIGVRAFYEGGEFLYRLVRALS